MPVVPAVVSQKPSKIWHRDSLYDLALAADIKSGKVNFDRDGIPGVSMPRGQGPKSSSMWVYYARLDAQAEIAKLQSPLDAKAADDKAKLEAAATPVSTAPKCRSS